MTIDHILLITLRAWAKSASLGHPHRLEIWKAATGHVYADVYLLGINSDVDLYLTNINPTNPSLLMDSTCIGREGQAKPELNQWP